jgi:deferrochelatase/peroxidase EfeB
MVSRNERNKIPLLSFSSFSFLCLLFHESKHEMVCQDRLGTDARPAHLKKDGVGFFFTQSLSPR